MQIPGLSGLKPLPLGKRAVKEFLDDDMSTYAAALAYHTMFALFPFLIFLLGLLSVLQIPEFFTWVLDQARTAMPQDAYQRVEEVVTQIQGQSRGGLLSIGLLTALWAASSGMRALMNALNTAYDVEESRPTWQRYLFSILYTIGLAVLLTAAVVYYVAPNVDQPFRFITPGAALTVIIWIIASLGFSLYVTNFANYTATYGTLGGVVVLLFYFFISASVLLLGAEINAEVHYAKAGQPEPKADEASA